MFKSEVAQPKQETIHAESDHHLVCWKSIFAGLLITLMAFLGLTALGAGIAGFTTESLISHEDGGSALATGAGLYFGLSVVVSLFCGSYFSLRVSRFVTNKVGAAHGFAIASLFFLIMIFGAGNMIGGLAQGFGKFAKGAGDGASALSNDPTVQDAVNKALGGANLKSDPREVASGLAARLVQGDVESAKSYYAYQSGLSNSDVDTKINQLKSDFDAAAKRAGEKTAHAIGDAGLFLSVLFLVGLIGAVMGGRSGAHANVDRPFSAPTTTTHTQPALKPLRNERGSVAPYFVGWLLGVPVSILFLIAILRSVF